MRRNGVWDAATWDVLVAMWLQQHRAERANWHATGFTDDECERLLGALSQLVQRFPCEQSVLLHGDFTPGHLFFDDTYTFTGVVDFGQFHGGSPVFDIDLILPPIYGGPAWNERIRVEWLREGYGAAPFWDTLAAQRLLYAMHNDLGVLNSFVMAKQAEPLAILVPGLRTLLARAEHYLHNEALSI